MRRYMEEHRWRRRQLGLSLTLRLEKVSFAVLDITSSHSLTGGVYKTRERIHRDMSDSRLLVIPTSRGRIAALYPN